MDSVYDSRPDPFWLRALMAAHERGSALPRISGSSAGRITPAEWGGHLAGSSKIEESVFRFRYLGTQGERWRIFEALHREAIRNRDERNFKRVHCPDCLSRLVTMVVDEEQISHHLTTDVWRARYMGVSADVWRYRYDKPHSHLKCHLDRWANGAVGNIKRNLYGESV